MTTGKTQVHLVSGKHEEVEGAPEDIAAQLEGGRGLVRLGDIFVNPAHVTHLIGAGFTGGEL